jgi:hypothetical protein
MVDLLLLNKVSFEFMIISFCYLFLIGSTSLIGQFGTPWMLIVALRVSSFNGHAFHKRALFVQIKQLLGYPGAKWRLISAMI